MKILKKSWIILVLILGILICWIMQLKGTSMPIWHKASIVDRRGTGTTLEKFAKSRRSNSIPEHI